jgi:scyllo-inositol 2-dehydrogenase (NADP+)
MPTGPEIHAGLIGFGLAGRVFHAPMIRAVPGLRLSAILERRGDEAQQRYPDVRVVRSLDEMLAIESIRLIVVATPNTSHYDIAAQCLQAGRDVVVDKPFATTYAEAAELVRIANGSGRLLTVFHNRRWDGDFRTVCTLVKNGTLGDRIVLFESHFERYRPHLRPGAWRESADPGSGILFDLGPHLIDQVLVLLGPPLAITADVRSEREGAAADDAFDIVLHYPESRAVLRSTMLACEPGPRFIVHGTHGSYLKHGLDPQEEALARGETPNGNTWGLDPEERWGTLTIAENGSAKRALLATEAGDYRLFYINVRDAIVSGAPLEVTPEQALTVMQLLELARRSSAERRTIDFKPIAIESK